MLFKSALFIAGAGLAVAQTISNQCSSALLAIASNSQATCLDLLLLAPLATNSNTTSVIPTINSWLGGMCSQGPCSNSSLQYVVDTAVSGCSAELASYGLTTNDTSSLVTTIQEAYPTVRQVVCLKDTSTSTLCPTELLTDIQSTSGTTITINYIAGLFTQITSGTASVNIPQNDTCSNCSKAAYTIVSQNFPSLLTGQQSAVQSECGSSFTDGQMPSGIQETAANSTSSSGAASLSASSLNVGVAMLIAVFSTFAAFA